MSVQATEQCTEMAEAPTFAKVGAEHLLTCRLSCLVTSRRRFGIQYTVVGRTPWKAAASAAPAPGSELMTSSGYYHLLSSEIPVYTFV